MEISKFALQQPNMKGWKTKQPSVQPTMTVEEADRKPHYSQDSLCSQQCHDILDPIVVWAADHGSYIVKIIVRGEYKWACDHIHEHHPDTV